MVPARLALASLLVATLGACGDGTEPTDAAPARNVLLVTIDTLRADALGSFGAQGDASPLLDRLASESVLFTRAYSPSTVTHPALTSILTGLIPPRSGVLRQRDRLRPEVATVAELVAERGYATGSFVANMCTLQGHTDTVMHRGWDERHCGLDMIGEQYLWDRDVVRRAEAWIGEQEGPWFAWVHLMDPHSEHRPDPELWDHAADPPGTNLEQARRRGELERARDLPGAAELERLERLYAAEVLGVDGHVGQLMAFIDRLPSEERPALLFTADHGEELYETWSKEGHGKSLTEGVLHVPLFLRVPGLEPGVDERLVSTLQVAPTLLELMDTPAGTALDGASLLQEGPGEGLAVSFTGSFTTLRTEAARFWWNAPILQGWPGTTDLLEHTPWLADAPWFQKPRLFAEYDPAAPHQPIWRAFQENPRAKRMQVELEAYLQRCIEVRMGGRAKDRPGPIDDAAFDEQLRALGYLGDEPGD